MARKGSTRRDALLLTRANLFKSALQLFTPLVLVRLVDQTEFGEYRLFWLVANTAVLLLPLGVERSLLYFLPRSTPEDRTRFVSQTVFYFLGISLLAGAALILGRFWLPDSINNLTQPAYVLTVFTALWLLAEPIRMLPNADQNVVWQSRVIIAIAVLRLMTVIGVAWVTRDIQAVFLGLLAWALLQFMMLGYYIGTRYGFSLGFPTWQGLREQISYAVPFGLSQTLAAARRQGEQWIVALLFPPAILGIFSIGISFNVVLGLTRSSLGNVLLPRMSTSHAAGDTDRALALNNRGNIAIFAVVTPVVAFLWVFAVEIITVLYTVAYVPAVPVLRVYLIALMIMSVEVTTLMMLYNQGRYVMTVSAIILAVAIPVSYFGGQLIGITGVAIGSLAGEVSNRVLNFARAAKLLQIPMSSLQDWATLARILLACGLAGAVSGWITLRLVDGLEAHWTVALGAVLFALLYLGLTIQLGLGWLLSALAGRGAWTDQ